MKLILSEHAGADYLHWQSTGKRVLKRISELIKEIRRNKYEGIGKPAALLLALALWVTPPLLAQGSQYALRFYGTGSDQQDRVRIAIDDDAPGPDASAPCDVGNGSFTVELWLRGELAHNATAHAGGDQEFFDLRWIDGNIIVDRDVWGGSNRDWGISIAGGFVRFGTGRADVSALDSEHTIEGNVNVLDGTWHHVAVVRDAATGVKSIYVDGVLDYASPADRSRDDLSYPDAGVPGQQTPWGPYLVLAAEKHDAGPSYPSFNGYLDEVRIWTVARSATAIATSRGRIVAPDAPGLVAAWRFEEGSGTAVADASSAGSPAGELIAGVAGNGEWVAYASDPANTAPIGGEIFQDGFESGNTSAWSLTVGAE